jgi:hypothetical protein
MNRIQGFTSNTEEGIKIISRHDASIYIGEDFSIVSHTNQSTSITASNLILHSKISIKGWSEDDISIIDSEWLPTYVSINKNGTLLVRRYYLPIYILGGLVSYFLYHLY